MSRKKWLPEDEFREELTSANARKAVLYRFPSHSAVLSRAEVLKHFRAENRARFSKAVDKLARRGQLVRVYTASRRRGEPVEVTRMRDTFRLAPSQACLVAGERAARAAVRQHNAAKKAAADPAAQMDLFLV